MQLSRSINPFLPNVPYILPKFWFQYQKGPSKKFLWLSRQWVGRRKLRANLIGYVPKNDEKKKNSASNLNFPASCCLLSHYQFMLDHSNKNLLILLDCRLSCIVSVYNLKERAQYFYYFYSMRYWYQLFLPISYFVMHRYCKHNWLI